MTGTVDRCAQDVHIGQAFWPVDRAVDRLKSAHSRVGPIDRAVDRPESRCSLVLGAVDRAVNRQAQRSLFLTVGRSTVRSILTFLPANGQNFVGVINTPFEVGFHQVFKREKFTFLNCFITSFKRVLEL